MRSGPKLVNVLDAPAVARVLGAIVLAVLATLACAASAGAESFTVADTTDAPLANSGGTACESTHESRCTLRSAVQAAANTGGANTISLPAGEYALTGEIVVNGGTTSLTIDGAETGETIITTNELSPAFDVQGGKSLSISDLTVENSGHDFGGGALVNAGTLTVTRCELKDNVGGAIESTGSSVSVIDSTVEGNRASINGGAFSVFDGSIRLTGDTITHNSATHGGKGGVLFDREHAPQQPVEIRNSTISNNEGALGGALWLRADGAEEAGKLTIVGSSFEENTTENGGGAVYDEAFGPIAVERSDFSRNQAGAGGAIEVEESGPLSVSESTFSENKTSHDGGAIMTILTDTAVSRSTFARNSSAEEGGAIFDGYGGELRLVNDTFDGNRATLAGGALILAGSGEGSQAEEVLLNDTIVRNDAQDGGGLAPFLGPAYPYLKIGNTIVAQNTGGDCSGAAPTDTTGSADQGGNIDSDGSCFSTGVTGDQTGMIEPALGVAELANNGGPTETDALLAASPAIGGGLPGSCPGTDQRGISRGGEPCDSGAYQSAAPLSPPPSAPASSPLSPAGEPADTAGDRAPCRSGRVETINWRLPRGVRLAHLTVTLDGHTHRSLPRHSRSTVVSLVGLRRGTVTVRVTAITRSRVRYGTTRVYHPCVPARPGARHISDYLRRL